MGILNVTPDSFSDGAQFNHFDKALTHAQLMVEQGADIIDVGGESTRPGAAEVSVNEELDRVVPLVEKLAKQGIKVSVDTSKAQVMEESLKVGAAMINDVRALQEPNTIEVISQYQAPVCLMHMQGQPRTMQNAPQYNDVVAEVKSFLQQRINVCQTAGIGKELISIDPGFGFGKQLAHNLALLKGLNDFNELETPVLAGLSRKSMLGEITGRDISQRLSASISVALIAMQQGAKIIRVHDVKETVDAKQIYLAMLNK